MLVEIVSLGSLAVPLLLALAIAVRRIDHGMVDEKALAIVTACGAASAMIAAPIWGWASDRTRRRGAGRAGWILGGNVAGMAALLWVTQASSVTELTLAWCAAQLAYNSTFATLYGLIGDHTDDRDRSHVSGLFGASAVLSVVVAMGLATVLPKNVPALVLPLPALAVVVAAVAFVVLRRYADVPVAAAEKQRLSLRRQHQFWLIWLQRLLGQLAYSFVTAFGLFFLIRRVELGEERAATWVAGTAAAAAILSAVASVVAGRIARNRSYLPFIVTAMVLLAAGSVVKAIGDDLQAYVVATVLVAVAIGCYYAVDLALVLRVVPPGTAGQLLGVFNIARTLPQSLAPALAPAILAWGDGDVVGDSSQNYFALYSVGAAVALIALCTLPWTVAARRRPT